MRTSPLAGEASAAWAQRALAKRGGGARAQIYRVSSNMRGAASDPATNPNPVEGRAQGAAGGALPVAPFIAMSYIGANPRNIILVRSRLNGAPVHLSHARNVQGLCWRQEGAG